MSEDSMMQKKSLVKLNQKLREDLLANLDEYAETIVVATVEKYLNSGDVERGIAALEILGKDPAFEIYQKLGQAQQTLIRAFMIEKSHAYSDPRLLYQSGKEILADLRRSKSWNALTKQGDRHTRDLLTQLEISELQILCRDLSETAVIRLLIYLEPSLLARLLQILKPDCPGEFDKINCALQRIHEASSLDSEDAAISEMANRQLKYYRSTESTAIMNYYQALIENAPEELAYELVTGLGQKNFGPQQPSPNQVKTIREFLELPGPLQQRILLEMSPREFVYLLIGLPAEQRRILARQLDKKTWNSLGTELRRAQELGNSAFTSLHQNSKEKLLSRTNSVWSARS